MSLESERPETIPADHRGLGFHLSQGRQYHLRRRQAILARHPEIAKLAGKDSRTIALMLAVVGGQLSIAVFLGRYASGSWWITLIAAYLVGAYAAHALFVLIHECCHNRIFESPTWNKIAGIVADLASAFPTAVAFRCYHIKHHSHLGNYDFDADLPGAWEIRIFGRSWYGKAAWLFLFPILQVFRLARIKGTVPIRSVWMIANLLAVIVADVAIWFAAGPTGLLYLAASLYFSIGGLHVLSGRLIQEHFTLDPLQETAGYYGSLNTVALNAGYHNEHHDFPDVPWTQLPAVKAAAPEYYDALGSYRSWTKLIFSFIFDPRFTLHSRVSHAA